MFNGPRHWAASDNKCHEHHVSNMAPEPWVSSFIIVCWKEQLKLCQHMPMSTNLTESLHTCCAQSSHVLDHRSSRACFCLWIVFLLHVLFVKSSSRTHYTLLSVISILWESILKNLFGTVSNLFISLHLLDEDLPQHVLDVVHAYRNNCQLPSHTAPWTGEGTHCVWSTFCNKTLELWNSFDLLRIPWDCSYPTASLASNCL